MSRPANRLNHDICCPSENSDRRSCLRNLQIITALDSLSYGLLYRYIPHIIQKMVANQIHVGVLLVGLCLADLMSSQLLKTFTLGYGKRNRLVFILCVNLLTTLMIASSKHFWTIVILRIFFSSVNKTQQTLLELALAREINALNKDKLWGNFQVLSKWGLVAGPVIGAFLYDRDKGFQEICSFSAILTFTNIVLAVGTMSPCQEEIDEELLQVKGSVVQNTTNSIKDIVRKLKECEFSTNWDILLVRSLFTTSFFIFLAKIRGIFKNFFDVQDAITIGCTMAFTTALEFAFNYHIARQGDSAYPLAFVFELSLFLCSISMLLTMLVPWYQVFILLNIPTMFLYCLINGMWSQLFQERNNDALSQLSWVPDLFTRLAVPVPFGVVFEVILGPYWGFLVFTCLPLIVSWVITSWYSRLLTFEKQEEEDVDFCMLGEDVHCM